MIKLAVRCKKCGSVVHEEDRISLYGCFLIVGFLCHCGGAGVKLFHVRHLPDGKITLVDPVALEKEFEFVTKDLNE